MSIIALHYFRDLLMVEPLKDYGLTMVSSACHFVSSAYVSCHYKC